MLLVDACWKMLRLHLECEQNVSGKNRWSKSHLIPQCSHHVITCFQRPSPPVTSCGWISRIPVDVSLILVCVSRWCWRADRWWLCRPGCDTGGEGLWKQVITWWEHCGIRCNVLNLFLPDTFCSNSKCNLNMFLQCIHSLAVQMFPQMFPKCSWPAPTMISQWNHYVVCLLAM